MADTRKTSVTMDPLPGASRDPVADSDFDSVIRAAETLVIGTRRKYVGTAQAAGSASVLPGTWSAPPRDDVVGLALSGGGIRSATFNLGVLQRLAELKVLPFLDYLSTVSGGGFIGGWWSSWMHRCAKDKDSGKWLPASDLSKPFAEPLEVEHLRLYSNYLIPRKGLFSPDTWRAITVVLRNLIVTQVMVAALLAAVFLLVDWSYVAMMPDSGMLDGNTTGAPGAPAAIRLAAVWLWPLIIFVIVWFIFTVAFLLVASGDSPGRQWWQTFLTQWHARLFGTFAILAAVFALAGFSDLLLHWLNSKVGEKGGWLAVLPGAVSAIYTALKKSPSGGGDAGKQKESVVGGLVMKLAPVLALLTLAVLLGAGAWRLLRETYAYMNRSDTPVQPGWIFIAPLIIIFGISQLYFLRSLHTQRLRSLPWRDSFHARDPQDFGIIFIAVSSFIAGYWLFISYADLHRTADWICLACFLSVLQCAFGVGFAADPNALSMHNFYKSRIVRAYLGATNQVRLDELNASKEEVSRPAKNDDLPLCDLAAWKHGGPLHILNTTLNLVGAQDLTAEQRQAEVFELTPLFCGSLRSGYRPTALYADGCLSLGTAVAVSGAAASTNMGSNTSVPLAMLLSFFNVRLGYWIANPGERAWRYPWTRFWLWYMVREMFAQTTSQGRFSFLSDGGHLENLGLYSLVKRRCRYIIVCDAGADPEFKFEDLANVIRMIRIDFGCEVDLDVSRLRPIPGVTDPFRRSEMHYAIGKIRYPGSTLNSTPNSTLIYLKNSLTKGVPTDIQGYAHDHFSFPHQTTADQFFDEAQFESYRRLGYHVADSVFREAASINPPPNTRADFFALLDKIFAGRFASPPTPLP